MDDVYSELAELKFTEKHFLTHTYHRPIMHPSLPQAALHAHSIHASSHTPSHTHDLFHIR